MGDRSAQFFVHRDDPIPTITINNRKSRSSTPTRRPASPSSAHRRAESRDSLDPSDTDTPSRSSRGIRGRLSAFNKEKARFQDHLVEKLLAQVVPLDDGSGAIPPPEDGTNNNGGPGAPPSGRAEKPNFTLPTMSNNFRRFNARIGVVFKFQARAIRLFAWRRPTHTLSFLAVYTFVCLDPSLLPLLPLVILLIGVLIPSFIARHPAADYGPSSSDHQQMVGGGGYSAQGPPLAPPVTGKQLSYDFFHNMRDLQNCMEDYSQMHDAVLRLVVPHTNFSDEAQSSALFVVIFAACIFVSVAAHILPWRLIFLVLGWAAVLSGHPGVQKQLEAHNMLGGGKPHEEREGKDGEKEVKGNWAEQWVARDVILDSPPETREVEIFELQRHDTEWEPWVFSASPYDPLSAARLAGDRPLGTRFFEDVQPPRGWEWSEKKWALDLWSREWVEERIITGVEIETEGERWVYDIFDERVGRIGVVDDDDDDGDDDVHTQVKEGKGQKPSWEEGEDGDGRRGEWRRRRWVRMVKRKYISRDAVS